MREERSEQLDFAVVVVLRGGARMGVQSQV